MSLAIGDFLPCADVIKCGTVRFNKIMLLKTIKRGVYMFTASQSVAVATLLPAQLARFEKFVAGDALTIAHPRLADADIDDLILFLTSEQYKHIKKVNLSCSDLGDRGAIELAKLPLTDLNLGYNNVTALGAKALFKSRTLRNLVLEVNILADDVLDDLMKNKTLTHINLCATNLTNSEMLAKVLIYNPNLTILFDGNRISRSYLEVTLNEFIEKRKCEELVFIAAMRANKDSFQKEGIFEMLPIIMSMCETRPLAGRMFLQQKFMDTLFYRREVNYPAPLAAVAAEEKKSVKQCQI